MSSEFRDAIGNRAAMRAMMVRRGNPDMGGPNHADKRFGNEIAYDILATPEMEAIRQFLRGVEADLDWESLRAYGIPESVIDWVLS